MDFDIVDKLLGMTLFGTEWVLWLLVILSIVSIAVMLERTYYFFKIRLDFSSFATTLTGLLSEGKTDEAIGFCEAGTSFEAATALAGLKNKSKGKNAMQGAMEGFIVGGRQRLDRGLVILGTLGNNAPFIGLFGTVLGIIVAFQDLSNNPEGGPSVVMGGISEALVATAVGLMVAIPAVIAFNAFNRMVKRRMANSEAVMQIILTYEE